MNACVKKHTRPGITLNSHDFHVTWILHVACTRTHSLKGTPSKNANVAVAKATLLAFQSIFFFY
jgi:hypothetical protein